MAATSVPAVEPSLTELSTTNASNAVVITPWPTDTTYEYFYPSESRTPDIDPGMTPYSGPTQLETEEPTPTWENPGILANATPTDPQTAIPYLTADVVHSSTFELPPGAYGVDPVPSSTETMEPIVTFEPQDAAGSSVLPRWLSYLLFIFLGISGVAGLALIGSYLGPRRSEEPPKAAAPLSPGPVRDRGVRLLLPGSPEPTIEQQILIDRIAGFEPRTMHVERLGQNLLRLERAAQAEAQDRSVRFGHLLDLGAIPSTPVPAQATVWARAHGFRVLAVDGSGMALVMPALSTGGRSVLGALPIDAMVEGASRVPMSIHLTESERGLRSRPASSAGPSVL